MKCYNCGGDVFISPGGRIGICLSCMAEIPLPKENFVLKDACSKANEYLSESRFDKALQMFQDILVQEPTESAACWGMALAYYGIEFVADPLSGEMLPTLHRLSQESFSDHLYVKKAIEYALSFEARDFYIRQSRLIDEIQRHSLQISGQEEPYDIFICYKKTEESEKRTPDSRMAGDIYRELTARGYKVFFADVSLKAGDEYEPRIFAALHSARVLIAVASRVEYYESAWVSNEWSRYADLIRKENETGRTDRLLVPMYRKLTHNQLPQILRQQPSYIEVQNAEDSKQSLLKLIGEAFCQENAEDVSDIRRATVNIRRKQKEKGLEENILDRGVISLASGDFETAQRMYERVLSKKESYEAYLGLLMCRLHVRGKEGLYQYADDICGQEEYRLAMRCADVSQKEELENFAEICLKNREWEKKRQQKLVQCRQKADEFVKELKAGRITNSVAQPEYLSEQRKEDYCAVLRERIGEFRQYYLGAEWSEFFAGYEAQIDRYICQEAGKRKK